MLFLGPGRIAVPTNTGDINRPSSDFTTAVQITTRVCKLPLECANYQYKIRTLHTIHRHCIE